VATDGVEREPEAAQLATLGRLTRGALHELANPVLALLGNAELAAAEAEPGTKLHDRLETIQRTGLEISEIVRALQAYIRAQDAPVGQVGLAESASAAVALLRRVSSTRDVELSVRAEGQPQVRAQPGSVLRSLVELVLDRLATAERGEAIELVVSERDGAAIAAVEGGGTLRLDAVAVTD
jgi:signal transduction histidine kinase